MTRLTREERNLIARRRLMKNLGQLVAAGMRTLEMKIADSGPAQMRINPHVLTTARKELIDEGLVTQTGGLWYHRTSATAEEVAARIAVLKPLHDRTAAPEFTMRLGQTLEIATLKGLNESGLDFVGGFNDLEDHDDSTLFSKEEPPLSFSNRRMPGNTRFDFLVFHPSGPIGIEAKNIREWLYPDREEVRELLYKATFADTLPVLIARRVPYVTLRLLQPCGVMVFQNFNQLYPEADAALADEVRRKEDLGYHDVRVGPELNPRLRQFLVATLGAKAPEMRERFAQYRDLLEQYGSQQINYTSFAARVRRREAGQPEDFDEPEEDPSEIYE